MNKSLRTYSDYFGIRENAFAITPDPRYLFMSGHHREALAHLLYGTEEGGGFVQLTGEVGTGKTTICRAFLEQLPENVDVALLLNPPDSGRELLLAIACELRLPLPKHDAGVRELVGILNTRLLESHAAGRRTVVIIDEAQNIRNDVLEQVRLLTNLETPTHKLLQVFLIGQPELRQKLESPALRQVAQRITARYHLEPLNLLETKGYIRHRLAVAGCRQGLFSAAAIKQIFRQSRGIPRVINILCDRALLGAFATDKFQVSGVIVRYAAREWRGEQGLGRRVTQVQRNTLLATMVGLLLAAAVGFAGAGSIYPAEGFSSLAGVGSWTFGEPRSLRRAPTGEAADAETAVAGDYAVNVGNGAFAEQVPAQGDASPELSAQPEKIRLSHTATSAVTMSGKFPVLAQSPGAVTGPETVSAQSALSAGELIALQALLDRWHIDGDAADRPALCEMAVSRGLRCLRDKGGWDAVRSYNRPALLTMTERNGMASYLAIVGMNERHALVATSRGVRQVRYQDLDSYWSGEFVILWRPPAGVSLIGRGSARWAVKWLQQALARVDGQQQRGNVFDQELRQRLLAFQQSRGLFADGIAGPRTLIHLNSFSGEQNIPLLVSVQGNTL